MLLAPEAIRFRGVAIMLQGHSMRFRERSPSHDLVAISCALVIAVVLLDIVVGLLR